MDTPPAIPTSTTRRIKRVAPLQAGKILGILYAAMGLIFMPFIVIFSLVASHLPHANHDVLPVVFGVGFAIAMPIIYGVMGFLIGVIGAAIYNLVAKWIGGFEVDVE